MNLKIVALDIGDVRIGIAVSDERRLIATPLEVYKRIGYGPDTRHIAGICEENQTTWVLCGLPMNMDGTEGSQAQKTMDFAMQLHKAGLKVFFQDERMTTLVAEKALIQGGMRRETRKGTVDKVAAALILQQWLDQNKEPADFFKEREEKVMEIQETIIELIDEEGKEVQFEHLMTIEHEEEYYIVLVPVMEGEDDEEEEVVILKLEKDEQGEDCYVSIEEEEILDTVFAMFIKAMEEELEDEEEEEDAQTPFLN